MAKSSKIQTKYKANVKRMVLLACLSLCFACEEVIDDFISVDAPSVLVADAWLTNQKGGSFVRLSKSDNFNNTGSIPVVSGALIKVSNLNSGTNIFFIETSPGYYTPADSNFVGLPKATYEISISAEGKTSIARGEMSEIPTVKELVLVNKMDESTFVEQIFLEVHLVDNETARHFYFWRLWVDSLPSLENEILLSNDRGLNGQNIIYEFPTEIHANNTVKVKCISITEKANQYYQGLQQLTANNGLSRTVPENPPSNFDQGILGFFTVAAVSEATLLVENE